MLEISPQGEIWLQGAARDDAAVQQQLQSLGQRNPQAEVQLRADTSVPYGRVANHGLGPCGGPDPHRLCHRSPAPGTSTLTVTDGRHGKMRPHRPPHPSQLALSQAACR